MQSADQISFDDANGYLRDVLLKPMFLVLFALLVAAAVRRSRDPAKLLIPTMVSIYRWKGSIERGNEHQVVIKTGADRLTALEARLRQLHPYELPEFLVLDLAGGGAAYLAWVRESVVL